MRFPITWWIGRRTDDAEPEEHFDGHYPYTRHVRLGWARNAAGAWQAASEDPHQWEVFCEQCGDTDGPAEVQPESARELRGPYWSKHKAEHVAKHHCDQMTVTERYQRHIAPIRQERTTLGHAEV